MANPTPSVRQRKPLATAEEPTTPTTTKDATTEASGTKTSKSRKHLESEDAYSPWVDVLRVVTFLVLASCGLSYLISGGETWFWGMKNPPNYLQVGWWKSQLVSTAVESGFIPSHYLRPICNPANFPSLFTRADPSTLPPQNWRRSTAMTRPSPSTSPSTGPSTMSLRIGARTALAVHTTTLPGVTLAGRT